MEVELKLLVDTAGAQALRDHPLLKKYAKSAPHELDLSSTYFDTVALDIRHSDAGLRVRQDGSHGWVQTLKGGGDVNGGLHSRHEWESPVSSPTPDLGALRELVDNKSEWGKLLRSPALKGELAPMFTTRVKRTVWDLQLPEGDEVECVLDQGNLEHDNDSAVISEVELELKSGDPTHLFDFALALQEDIPMQVGNLSKADRGYALVTPQPAAAVKALPLKLSGRMTIEQAFQAIVRNCMMQIQSNEGGVVQANDVESLHQMRVGMRRLRSALGLFEGVMQPTEEMQVELTWLATELGAARDWDVLAGSTLPKIADNAPQQLRIAAIKVAAQQKAHDHHASASAAVRSPRYVRLMLGCTRWVSACGWRDGMTPENLNHLTRRLQKFADARLRQHRKRLLKRGKTLKGATPEERHRVRIAAKKMRYTTEFFQSLYSAKKVRPFVRALSTLQDELGWLNDVAVADGLLKELQDQHADLTGRAGFIRGYLVAHGQGEERSTLGLWKKFAPMKLPS